MNGHEYLFYGLGENFVFFVVVKTHWLSLMDDEYCFKTIYEEEIPNDHYETTPSLWVCYKVY